MKRIRFTEKQIIGVLPEHEAGAKIVIEKWRKHGNTVRPHSALGYRPPAPQTFAPVKNHLDENTNDAVVSHRLSKISIRSVTLAKLL